MSKDKTMRALNSFLRPEFLSRIDEVVCFEPLTHDVLCDIADLMLSEYVKPMEQKGITFTWDKSVCKRIVEKAQGGKFGARDIRRIIRKEIEDAVAEIIVGNNAITAVNAYTDDGDIKIKWS